MFNWKWSSTKTEPHNKAANAQRKPLKDLQKTWETFAEDYFSFKKMTRKAGSLEEQYKEVSICARPLHRNAALLRKNNKNKIKIIN